MRGISGSADQTPPVVGPVDADTFNAERDDEPARDLLLPRSLAHYRLLTVLGRGGFGCVYKAWDERLEREVALKVLSAGVDSRATAALTEARLSARIEHPTLVRVYECLNTPEGSAIAMELVRGRTFATLLSDGPMTCATALPLVRQVAAALAAAHARGLIHGDIKASNLMRTDEGQARILDFGLARPIETATRSDAVDEEVAGTLAYLAPEVLMGHAPSARSDIYALGVVLFELISGARPYAEHRGARLVHAIVHGDAPVAAHAMAAAGVAALLESMLSRDPRRRLASMDEVCRRIDALALASSVRSAPYWTRRRRSLFVLAGLWVAALGVMLGADHGFPPTLPSMSAPARDVAANLVRAESLLRNFDEPGAVARAIALLDPILAARPGHAAAAAALALAYCLRYTDDGRDPAWLARARAAAEVALRADDQLALAHAAHGWVNDLEGDATQAEAAYARTLTLEPGEFFALLGQIRLLTRERRFAQAEATLDRAFARWPEERLFHDALGTLRYQQADYVRAEAAFRHSLTLKPDSPFAYANLNAALLRQGRTDEALAVLQQGLRVRPHARLYSNLGTALFAAGRYVEAADAFERALSDTYGEPNDYLKWANLGDALHQIPGRHADARRAYARTMQLIAPRLERAPDDATLSSRAALYAAKLGDAPRAHAWSAQALRAAPDSADVAFRAGFAAELLGDRDEALARLARALSAGYPRHLIETEPELIALRRDRRWHDLALTELAADE